MSDLITPLIEQFRAKAQAFTEAADALERVKGPTTPAPMATPAVPAVAAPEPATARQKGTQRASRPTSAAGALRRPAPSIGG